MNPPQGRETKADSVRDALAALGATADDAVMIGDRFNDVEGAHAMGVPCIGIYSGAAAPGEHEAAGADAVVHSVAELAKLFLYLGTKCEGRVRLPLIGKEAVYESGGAERR